MAQGLLAKGVLSSKTLARWYPHLGSQQLSGAVSLTSYWEQLGDAIYSLTAVLCSPLPDRHWEFKVGTMGPIHCHVYRKRWVHLQGTDACFCYPMTLLGVLLAR